MWGGGGGILNYSQPFLICSQEQIILQPGVMNKIHMPITLVYKCYLVHGVGTHLPYDGQLHLLSAIFTLFTQTINFAVHFYTL